MLGIVANISVVVPHPLDFPIVHPVISIGEPVGLNNSINSSFAPPDPLVLNSLMRIVVAACCIGAALTG